MSAKPAPNQQSRPGVSAAGKPVPVAAPGPSKPAASTAAPAKKVEDDGWSDDEEQQKSISAPKIIGTYRVIEDYLPETNAHLTLILDDLVYVFRQSGPDLPAGFWEGETLGVTGIFPAKYVEINKTLDQEIAEGKAKRI